MADPVPAPVFGPTLKAELIAAGLEGVILNDQFIWNPAGLKVYQRGISAVDQAGVEAVIAAHDPTLTDAVPISVTLANWRVGLDLWMHDDSKGGQVSRLTDVQAAVKGLVDAGNPVGKVAYQQLEYSNTAERPRLLALHEAFGFTAADVDESLHRADRVAQGDFSGKWPVPAKAA